MTPHRRPRQRGMAALTVVMVLFFVMALVAAYTNRNLVFEQRISANSYRATRALEAADAGVEWTIGMLNAGRITAACAPPAPDLAGGLTDFRSRYLVPAMNTQTGEPDAFGLAWGQAQANRVYPTCVVVDGTPRCACPALGEAAVGITVPADGVATAFRITFRLFDDVAVRGGAMQLVSRGCSNPGTGDTSCIAQNDDPNAPPAVDGTTAVIATVGLVRALPVAPKAALSAGGIISVTGSGELQVSNNDFATGLTVHAGKPIEIASTATVRLAGPAGSSSDGLVDDDTKLADLSAQGTDPWFRALFVLDMASYRRQPAVVRLACEGAVCTHAELAAQLALNPRNPIWADRDVNINADTPLGTAADPMMLIVNGTLTVSGNAVVSGFVHANQITWTAGAASVDGAVVSATTIDVTGVATVRYDKAMLDTIRLRYGSFVRVPGGWNLF